MNKRKARLMAGKTKPDGKQSVAYTRCLLILKAVTRRGKRRIKAFTYALPSLACTAALEIYHQEVEFKSSRIIASGADSA
eukprot:scaffold256181_cov15-Tisochrysis_lutea.AAC.1